MLIRFSSQHIDKCQFCDQKATMFIDVQHFFTRKQFTVCREHFHTVRDWEVYGLHARRDKK